MRRALIAGGSGLIGRALIDLLLADASVGEVHLLVRKPLALVDRKLVVHQVDFDRLGNVILPAVDEFYCCLGTTIKIAGSQAAFRRVDHDYVIASGQLARRSGATRMALVTAGGSNAGSRIFYSRVKGETEDDVARLGFDRLVIMRPSLLLGERDRLGQPERGGEGLATTVMTRASWLLPRRFRPIEAVAVARAMVAALGGNQPGSASGTIIYENESLLPFAT